MIYRIVVADRVNAAGLALLEKTPDLEVVNVAGDAAGLAAQLPTAHALLVRSETRVTADLLEKATALKVIGRAGIGVDTIDVAAATRRGIAVLNAPGANTVSAAEHTLALLLGLVRHIPTAAASMREGKWDRKAFEGRELRRKTLGIVGLGRIGAHLSQIARAFGMQVIGHDPFLSEKRAAELHVELLPLDELLPRADVLTLHLPLTDETRNVIDRRRLGLLKPTAVLVNAARGGLVDEEALVEALENGTIAGAAIDVFSKEPLPKDHPLRTA
ncbi:MAG TPA: hydroxyacid dehydrogenase, partial [Gemmatimonadales bacterium]|nr:hydroxyacid dehydrogenase [Gemmatimonadales bacterium]